MVLTVTAAETKSAKMKAKIIQRMWSAAKPFQRMRVRTRDVVSVSSKSNKDTVQNAEEGESPRDTVNDGNFAGGSELVNHASEEENMNDSPVYHIPCIRTWNEKKDMKSAHHEAHAHQIQ
jgi:hypothetical protein